MIKLLILGKNGTLIRPASGNKLVQSPSDQILLMGVDEAILQYAADGWRMAIASNQKEVATGHKTLNSAIDEMRYCLNLLHPFVEVGCLCPDLEGLECYEVRRQNLFIPVERDIEYREYCGTFRKPNPGMLKYLISEFCGFLAADLTRVLMVGDRLKDEQAAQAAGIQFIWADKWRSKA